VSGRGAVPRPAGGAPCSSNARAGVTLIELIVVLALLGGVGVIAGLSWQGHDPERWGPRTDPDTEAVETARRRALASGRPAEASVETERGTFLITALPDGRVLGGGGIGWDPLSGRRLPSPQDGSP